MYLNIRKHKEAKNYTLFDKDTGLEIKYCFEANDETGEYSVYDYDYDGNNIKMTKINGIVSLVELHKKGNIELRKVK